MTSPLRKSLVDAIVASGCTDPEEAAKLAATPSNGLTWTVHVLNSGKVDEQRLTTELGRLFNTPVESIDMSKVARSSLGSLPSRFVFKHQILPLGPGEKGVRLATYDVFNSAARRLATQLLPGKKIEWVLVPRTQLLRSIKA